MTLLIERVSIYVYFSSFDRPAAGAASVLCDRQHSWKFIRNGIIHMSLEHIVVIRDIIDFHIMNKVAVNWRSYLGYNLKNGRRLYTFLGDCWYADRIRSRLPTSLAKVFLSTMQRYRSASLRSSPKTNMLLVNEVRSRKDHV